MKSPKYIELKELYNEALKILHDYKHPAVRSLKRDMEEELIYCYNRELYLNRFKNRTREVK